MRSKSGPEGSAKKTVKEIRRATRERHATEEMICIVLEGLRGEYVIAELCRREGIPQSCIIPGRKSFWKPVNGVWLAIRRVRQPRQR